jgi:hypothetical protein
MAVEGVKMAVVLGRSGSEGLAGPGNTDQNQKTRLRGHGLKKSFDTTWSLNNENAV